MGPFWLALATATWLNVSAPLTPQDLKGKLVLLDFGRDSCVACLRRLPELEKLEAAFPDELAVVEVYEPELPAQKDPRHARQAVIREDISHPVIIDETGVLARAYDVSSCPTMILVDDQGSVAGRFSGEGRDRQLEAAVAGLAREKSAVLDRRPLPLLLARDALEPSALSGPESVSVDEAGGRVFISDTGHNRVVIADRTGRVLDVIGSGLAGTLDGGFDKAQLDHPRGTALVGPYLYIADTGNDRIRQADLKSHVLRTLGQTMQMASPRDLAFGNDRLFIGATGFHRIMMYNTHTGALSEYAGSGGEDLRDGPLPAASLGQPSGLAFGDGALFFSDSEAGALRKIDAADPRVETLAKTGLQYPLGLAWLGGTLFVADSWNGRIARLDPKTGALSTLTSGFSEPGGLAAFEGGLLVADTGAGRLVRLSLDGKRSEPWTLRGLKTPPRAPPIVPMPAPPLTALPAAKVRPDAEARVLLDVSLPKGYKLHPLAPFFYRVSQTSGLITIDRSTRKGLLDRPKFPIAVRFTQSQGKAEMLLEAAFYYCREDGRGLCKTKSVSLDVPLEAAAGERRTDVPLSISAD